MCYNLLNLGNDFEVIMQADHVVEILNLLETDGIAMWLDGGWGTL